VGGPAPHQRPVTFALTDPRHIYRALLELAADRPYVPLGVLALSLASALCFAASSVLQQREARDAPPETAMRPGLVAHLVKQPLWLLGNVSGIAGFALQLLALRTGSLALVQPLLVVGLVFALAAGAALDRRWLTRRQWLWTGSTVGGLVLFLVASRPGHGHPHGSLGGWLLLGVLAAIVVSALNFVAHIRPQSRALTLGLAAGVMFGVIAALAERSAHLLDRGLLHALATWPPYALAVCAVLGLHLTQSAFQAGDIKWSLPALTVTEPLVAILIGQLLFGEHIALGALSVLAETVGLLLMAVGVISLSRSMPAPHRAADVP
jgi:drug/metabolite transporter (DMT)-like permease